jgi:hypothetical protein
MIGGKSLVTSSVTERAPNVRTLEYVTPQLPTIAPLLLVYLVGVVLSLVQLKRLAMPAAFALVGCGMRFVITLVFPFVQGYIAVAHSPVPERALWMSVVGIIRVLLQVTEFSLVLTAVFAGRRVPAGPG